MQIPVPPDSARSDAPSPLRTLGSRNKTSTVDLKSVRTQASAIPLSAGLVAAPDGTARVDQHVPQRQKIILLSTSCFVAFLAPTISFVWLVFGCRASGAMAINVPGGAHAINAPATMILLPVTLSIVVAFCAIRPILYLTSFLYAYYLVARADTGSLALLTRSEAGILVELLAGHLMPALRGLKSLFPGRHSASPLIKFASILSMALCLNCLVLVTMDVTLHVLTQTVEIQAPVTGIHQANMWGRTLITECVQSSTFRNDSFFQTSVGSQNCPVHLGIFSGEEEATQTARNMSATNLIVVSDGVALLVDARAADNSSFTASTYGLMSHCAPVGERCQLDGDSLTFLCPKLEFSGEFTKPFVLATATTEFSSLYNASIFFLVAAKFDESQISFKDFTEEHGVAISRSDSSLLTVFECVSQFRRWQYTRAPGAIKLLEAEDLAFSLDELLISPMIPGMIQGYSGFGVDLLTDGMAITSKDASSLAQLADSFANVFSRVAMAPVAPLTREIPVDSDLGTYQLTIVPLPLALVVLILNTNAALLVVLFGIIAYRSSRKPGVLYYQWELSTIEMMRVFFSPVDRPVTAPSHQNPNPHPNEVGRTA